MMEVGLLFYFVISIGILQWGGEFVVRNLENDYSYVAFIPNNGVLIPGWLDHTGMAPNRLSNQPRLSLAFTFQEV